MEAINTYINDIFRTLPDTADVRRAKSELLQMADDRYHELRSQGVSEHEAVGRVITQFGNLSEVADELGIRDEVDGAPSREAGMALSESEAERFRAVRRRGANLIAGGVMTILAGVAALVLLSEPSDASAAFDDGAGFGSLFAFNPSFANVGEAIGLVLMFLAVAVGVGMFIFAGISLNRYDAAERGIDLDPALQRRYSQMRDRDTGPFALALSVGIGIILLATAMVAVVSALTGDDPFAEQLSAAIMFLAFGVGAWLLITASIRRGTLSQLASEGDSAPENRAVDAVVERIAPPFWLVTIAIYLLWSFLSTDWQITWIVWPIAGILFGAVVTTIQAVRPGDQKRIER